jgi:hypothetical protein
MDSLHSAVQQWFERTRWYPQTDVDDRVDEKKYFHLFCTALAEGHDNVMCPIKIILILAHRSGNVHSTTIEGSSQPYKGSRGPDCAVAAPRPPRSLWSGSEDPSAPMGLLAHRLRGYRAIVRANRLHDEVVTTQTALRRCR